MQPQESLATAALIMSIVSTTLSVVALWPHLKERLSVVRDVVLWVALAGIAVALFVKYQKKSVPGLPSLDRRVDAGFNSVPVIPEIRGR